MLRLGEPFAFERTRKDPKLLRFLPEVQAILLGVDRGGFEEAVIRMLILMAESRGTVRRDRLERSAKVLGHDEPFASLGAEKRAALIHEQSIIVEFEPELAVKTLPELLPDMADRKRAIQVRRVHRRLGRGNGAEHHPDGAAIPRGPRPARPRPARADPGPAEGERDGGQGRPQRGHDDLSATARSSRARPGSARSGEAEGPSKAQGSRGVGRRSSLPSLCIGRRPLEDRRAGGIL